MILGGGLFFVIGLIANNYGLMIGSLAVSILGVLIEKR